MLKDDLQNKKKLIKEHGHYESTIGSKELCRFKQVKDGLLSAVSEMQYCAREMRKIVDSLWTMNLNEVSSRLQEMAMFLEGAVDRGHMAAEELSPPRLNF